MLRGVNSQQQEGSDKIRKSGKSGKRALFYKYKGKSGKICEDLEKKVRNQGKLWEV